MMANRFSEMNDNRNFSLEILLAGGKFLYLATHKSLLLQIIQL